MTIVKTYLCNCLNDGILRDNLICYVDKKEMKKVTSDPVIDHFTKLIDLKGNTSTWVN
jgi:hypothetical protein